MRHPALALSAVALLAFAVTAGGAQGSKTVRITASAPAWVLVGRTFAIGGAVVPHPPGLVLTLQQRQGTGWLSVGDGPVRPSGTFSFVATPRRLGRATYRVVTAKGSSYTGRSARVAIRVLHWQYLTSIESFAYLTPISGNVTTTPIVSGGVRYEHPVALDPGCYNQWGGAPGSTICSSGYERFAATAGLDDQAAPNASATYKLVGGDGRKLASGSLVRGAATEVQVSVAGEYRLRLWLNVPDPNNAAGCSSYFPHVVFGDAQLLGP